MSLVRILGIALLGLMLMQGCAFSRGTLGDEIKSDAIASIKKGTSTKAEVFTLLERLIGCIKSTAAMSFSTIATMRKRAASFSSSSISRACPSRETTCYVILNREGIVEDVISSKRTNGMEFRFWPFGE